MLKLDQCFKGWGIVILIYQLVLYSKKYRQIGLGVYRLTIINTAYKFFTKCKHMMMMAYGLACHQ